MGNVSNNTSSSEIKVNIDKLDRNIEEMNTLCTSIVNYTPEIDFGDCKGASIDKIINCYEQYLKIQSELTAYYANTSIALQLTRDSFNAVDNLLENFFKELTV